MVGLGKVVQEGRDCPALCYSLSLTRSVFFPDPSASGMLQCLLDHLLHARSVPEPEEHGLHPLLQEGTLPLAPTEPELQGGWDRARINAAVQQQGGGWNGFRE